jgi:hypothetical protein
LSTLLMFFKNQLFVTLILCIVLAFFIYLIPDLVFIIFCLLFAVGLFYSSFPTFSRWKI